MEEIREYNNIEFRFSAISSNSKIEWIKLNRTFIFNLIIGTLSAVSILGNDILDYNYFEASLYVLVVIVSIADIIMTNLKTNIEAEKLKMLDEINVIFSNNLINPLKETKKHILKALEALSKIIHMDENHLEHQKF